jgi:CBS domain-containing protein
MPVSTILKDKGSNVISAKPSESVQTVAKRLSDNRIGAVVVLDDFGRLAGIVSERDIVREIASQGAGVMSAPVSNVMSRHVRTCSSADNEETIVGLMTTNRIRHLPVVDNGKLCGMISIGDVVKHRMQQIERESEELQHYIRSSG